jgi:hypothetical protein
VIFSVLLVVAIALVTWMVVVLVHAPAPAEIEDVAEV